MAFSLVNSNRTISNVVSNGGVTATFTISPSTINSLLVFNLKITFSGTYTVGNITATDDKGNSYIVTQGFDGVSVYNVIVAGNQTIGGATIITLIFPFNITISIDYYVVLEFSGNNFFFREKGSINNSSLSFNNTPLNSLVVLFYVNNNFEYYTPTNNYLLSSNGDGVIASNAYKLASDSIPETVALSLGGYASDYQLTAMSFSETFSTSIKNIISIKNITSIKL